MAGDAIDDSFGGVGAKEDGQYSACQLAEVLKLVNDSSSTPDKLEDIGLAPNAAKKIYEHKIGPDGMLGTGDDDIFDDLGELDGVDYVGNLALGKLVYAVLPRCENDLADRPFIDDQTFTGQSSQWARDDDEVEVVLGVKGPTGQKLREALLSKNSSGRTLYDRIRKSHIMEAFTYGFSLDEMPWDSDSQKAREKMPYVSLTIEPDRYAPNDEGEMEISLGTDLMDDTYYDTHGYTLLGNGIELRGRARWDDPMTVRRILIAAKFGTEIDADGNKVNAKVDIRNDNGTAFVPKLDEDVRRGKVAWSGSDAPVTPIRGVYDQLKEKNLLLDIGAHHGVLLLEPAVHLRSTRSRYHMNETNISNVRSVYANAVTRINAALAVVTRAKNAGIIPAADRAAVDALETLGKGIVDKSLIAQRLGVSVTSLRTPDSWPQPTTPADLETNKKTAEAINALYHEFATALDNTDRAITNAADESFDGYTDMFRAWRVSVEPTLARKRAWDPFFNSFKALTNRAQAIADFNTYGAAQKAANADGFDDFAPLDDAGWTRLGNYLEKMTLTTGERMIETGGLAAQQLWFDQARALYVPTSSRAYSNFMIDTTDMTDMLTHEEWTSIPDAERSFAQPLPAAKVFNTTFVNELQIELGMEKAYVERLKTLEAQVQMNPNDANLKAQLDGAKFVWAQYTGAMKVLTELKGPEMLDKLKKAGAGSNLTWVAPPDSKGNIALKILADRD